IAKAIPVLPLVASMSLEFLSKSPRCNPLWIMFRAARSFTLPPGLWPSNLNNKVTLGLVFNIRDSTSGVLPIRSRTDLDIRKGFDFNFRGMENRGIFRYRGGQPSVSADNRIFTDNGIPT